MGKVVSLYPSKPIYFYQYGYPSASVCKSSEILQAQFIDETFHAWDSFAKNIRVIDFTWLHDYSPASVKYYSTFYGITDSAFLGYLGSLGLRNYAGNGSDKLAYQELVCQASRHGYNNISCTTGINEAINNAGKINIYPNPFNDHFNIDIPEGNGAGRFILYNSNGQSVLNILVSEGDGIIKTNHLQSGIYFYRLIGKNGSIISDGKLIRI